MSSIVRLVIGGVFALALLAAGPFVFLAPRAPQSLPPAKSVIDMHAHVAGLGHGCEHCFVSPDLLDSYKYKWYLRAFGTSAAEMADESDLIVAEGLREDIRSSRWIRQALLLALDGVINEHGLLDEHATQVFIPNDYVAGLAASHEEFLFGASINPRRPNWRERLEQAKQDGAVLVKWIPSIMDIDPANHELQPFYEMLIALDLPLLVHVGDENAFRHADNRLGDPERLIAPLEQGVTIIAAHIGTTGHNNGEENFDRLIPMLLNYPNLYTDISSLTQINKRGYLRRALATAGVAERMVYGSDWPLQFFPLVWRWWHLGSAPFAELRYSATLHNPLDRDIALKAALGVPPVVFTRTSEVLRLPQHLVEEVQ
ncbi:MAG: amidohydrolase family protein [Gammaproteobacteria bacterium]